VSRCALLDAEKWLSVIGYEGLYLVSNFGRVYSEPRTEYVKSKRTGGHYRYRNAKYVKFTASNMGYFQVGLCKDGLTKRKTVHRLVAEAFIPNPDNLPEVNHIDGDKKNNHYTNLEWSTRTKNALHSTQTLLKGRGELNGTSKLTEKDVLEIAELLTSGSSQSEIAKMFNVTNHAIYRIHRGFNWSWLTGFDRKGVVCHV
jgi:hypothetical protein